MMRILVVNNKKDFNGIFYALREWGYEVKVAQTLAECRENLSATEFDIVFIRLEPDEDWLSNFRTIKETHPYLPLIGLTTLSKHKLNHLLNTQGISRIDFTNILHQPLKLRDLIFTIEEIIVRCQKELIEEEKPLTKKERQQRLTARRRPLEDQRLSDFLSAHPEQDIF